jgi:hypothetical protein
MMEFGKFGPIGSVKVGLTVFQVFSLCKVSMIAFLTGVGCLCLTVSQIMWPRTEEQKAVGRHCGFVSYLHRPFAEQAIIHLQGSPLLTLIMVVCV